MSTQSQLIRMKLPHVKPLVRRTLIKLLKLLPSLLILVFVLILIFVTLMQITVVHVHRKSQMETKLLMSQPIKQRYKQNNVVYNKKDQPIISYSNGSFNGKSESSEVNKANSILANTKPKKSNLFRNRINSDRIKDITKLFINHNTKPTNSNAKSQINAKSCPKVPSRLSKFISLSSND